jgi:hypothetical protein
MLGFVNIQLVRPFEGFPPEPLQNGYRISDIEGYVSRFWQTITCITSYDYLSQYPYSHMLKGGNKSHT